LDRLAARAPQGLGGAAGRKAARETRALLAAKAAQAQLEAKGAKEAQAQRAAKAAKEAPDPQEA
jgi:hypothetical protein